MQIRARLAAALLASLLAAACNKGGETQSTGTAPAGDTKSSSSRKLKTKLTSKQIEETWAGIKGNMDFKKHSDMAAAKLGPAQKVTGDQSCWYGYQPAAGPVPDDCMQLCTSATKGSGTQTTDGTGKCWD